MAPRRVYFVLVVAMLLTAVAVFAGDNPRVYITDSKSWEVGSGGAGVNDTFGTSGSGGARPQTAEIIKTFNQRCPNAIINERRDKADYVVVLDHEGGKSFYNRDNKIAVFNNASGDAIFSQSTRSLGNSVKDACTAIFRDWSRHTAVVDSNKQVEASAAPVDTPQRVAGDAQGARLQVKSTPGDADIEIDGNFVGNTPSEIQVTPGDHKVVVRKNGYVAWEKTLHVTGGDISLVAELEKE